MSWYEISLLIGGSLMTIGAQILFIVGLFIYNKIRDYMDGYDVFKE
jgi:hypothetical protein